MKKAIVLMTALMLAIAPMSALAQPESGASIQFGALGSAITVQGKASVYAEPDQATITFGVSAIDAEAAAAQSEVNKVLAEAVAAIKELGIAEKDILQKGQVVIPGYGIHDEIDERGLLTDGQ